jgi:C4-dicarboxylate transporter DctQ subunit
VANVLNRFDRIVGGVNRRASWISYAAIFSMMAFVFSDVILRYFGHPTSGSNDLVQLMTAVAVAFTMGYTLYLGRHPTTAILVVHLPPAAQRVIRSATSLLSLVVFVFLAWQTAKLARQMMKVHEGTMTLGLPLYPFIFCISAGSVLMCLICLASFLKSLRGVTK